MYMIDRKTVKEIRSIGYIIMTGRVVGRWVTLSTPVLLVPEWVIVVTIRLPKLDQETATYRMTWDSLRLVAAIYGPSAALPDYLPNKPHHSV